jgi:tRNA pseudouridine55 synthase
MRHGVLPILKPKGCTSHDVVNQIRRLTKIKKVGHTGTLDPEVEGVLPICLGQATRIAEYIQDMPKSYRGSLRLGIATDTEDHTGQVIEQKTVPPISPERIEQVFHQFHGQIEQVPPMYSAVKVGGKRLYELARSGKTVERKSRTVTIYSLSLIRVEKGEFPVIHFDVTCSKGTYVRTLCVQIGQALGLPAHMNSLVRTKSGPFHLEDCYTLDELKTVDWEEVLIPIDEVLGLYPVCFVSDEMQSRVWEGWTLETDEISTQGSLYRVYSESGRFLALYRQQPSTHLLKPEKVFRDVE